METCTLILHKNFEALYKSGFQALRTDKVVAELGITKGAFYHYFKDKYSLGYAIVDEIIAPMYINLWENALQQKNNSIQIITETITQIGNKANPSNIGLGCPLNNLIQEMSSIDENFRKKLSAIIDKKIDLIQKILQKGIDNQEVNPNIQTYSIACFIVSALEGSFSLGKSKNSFEAFSASIQTLVAFIQSLKA